MTKLGKLFAASVACVIGCVIGIALTACGGGLTLGVAGTQSPNITSQPASQFVETGKSATFSVAATGSATLIYQWKKNGSNIDGATSSSYTTPATSSADNGARYSVSVSNSTGSVTSGEASLTVFAAPIPQPPIPQPAIITPHPAIIQPAIITTQPTSQSVVAGQRATFTVKAAGGGTLGYQWQKNGTNIAGATSSTYTTPATSMADSGGQFSAVVSNSAGAVTSNDATLTVTGNTVAPTITQPAALTVSAGQTARFSVTATGTAPFSYQWKKNGINIAGATSSTYTTPAIDIGDNGAVFTVVVGNSAGTVTSSNATLTVTAAAVVGTQPSRYSLVANASGGFYDKTECVKDNSTGLVWEGKTASPATSRLGTSTYTNYDSTASAQKWNGNAYVNPITSDIGASTNSIGYRDAVRTSALCGFTDWRMPSKEELQGILSGSTSPTIDTVWFPNTSAVGYWSSSPYVGYPGFAWGVSFDDGYASGYNRGYNYGVRLVRS